MSTAAISALERVPNCHQLRFYAPAAIALLFVFVFLPLMAFGIRFLYRWIVE